jgi:ABC-2 type transport system permease protein
MKPYRIFTIVKKIFKNIRNDKRTLALLFIAPVFAMLLFGYSFNGEIKNITIFVVNDDQGYTLPLNNVNISISNKIISNFNSEILHVEYMKNVSEAIQKVESGNGYAVIYFPENFTKDIYMKLDQNAINANATIWLMEDESDINVANTINQQVNNAIAETIKEIGINPIISLNSAHAIYGKNATFLDFFIPGMIGFIAYLLPTLLTLISFVQERTSGTLDRMMATPLTEGEMVAGYAIAFGTIGTLQSLLLLTISIYVFNIVIVGSIVLAFIIIALLAITSQSLGILLSSLAKREIHALFFLPFIVIPGITLAGVFWPLEGIPSWLRPVSYFVPVTYAVEALRDVMIKGWGLANIYRDILALILFCIVFLFLAVLSLKIRGK